MNLDEMGEELEQQFGKPRCIAEENVKFMMSLIEEQFDGNTVDEDVPQPSVDAMGMTVLAVMSYPETPWEELARKPAICRCFKYVAVRMESHYDEVEALIKQLLRTHIKGVTQKHIFGFIKVIRALREEEHPSRLIENTPYPERYCQIWHGLHRLMRPGKNERAAILISGAIDDGVLHETVERELIIKEFCLTKSGFNKYFSMYHVDKPGEPESLKKEKAAKKAPYFTTLRAEIGYVKESDGTVRFLNRKLGRKSFLSIIIAYVRSIFSQ